VNLTSHHEKSRIVLILLQVVWHILLESYQGGLQLFFRPHLNRRSACKIMGFQSCENPNFGNSETPTWESQNKMHLGVGLVTKHREYYKKEGGGFPQV